MKTVTPENPTVSPPAPTGPKRGITPAPSPSPEPDKAPNKPEHYQLDGLHLSGICQGRQRRAFDAKGGAKRYAITLTILTQSGLYKPERWSDIPTPSDVPTVGEHVCLKVQLQVYQSKSGTNFRLLWGDSNQGESF